MELASTFIDSHSIMSDSQDQSIALILNPIEQAIKLGFMPLDHYVNGQKGQVGLSVCPDFNKHTSSISGCCQPTQKTQQVLDLDFYHRDSWVKEMSLKAKSAT